MAFRKGSAGLAAAALIGALAWAAPSVAQQADPATAQDGPQPVAVTVVAAGRTSLTQHLYTEGTAQALRREILQFDRSGRVVQIGTGTDGQPLHEGSPVQGPDAASGKDGTLIALLAEGKLADDLEARSARERAMRDRAEAARAAHADAQARLTATASALERAKTLVKQGVMPAKALEEAETASTEARNGVRKAQSELSAAQAEAEAVAAERQGAMASLREGALRAPFDGVVAFLNVREGSRAGPLPAGLAEADLLRRAPAVVISPDAFEIVAQIPWSQAISLQPGMEAQVTWGGLGLFEMYDDRVAAGRPADDLPVVSAKVWAVAPAVMPDTRSVRIRLRTTTPTPALRDGLYVSLRIVAATLDSVVTVPRQAIRHGGGKPYVFVVGAGDAEAVAERRTVDLGAPSRNLIQIVSGLQEGERVVVRGQSRLIDGARVRLVGGEAGS